MINIPPLFLLMHLDLDGAMRSTAEWSNNSRMEMMLRCYWHLCTWTDDGKKLVPSMASHYLPAIKFPGREEQPGSIGRERDADRLAGLIVCFWKAHINRHRRQRRLPLHLRAETIPVRVCQRVGDVSAIALRHTDRKWREKYEWMRQTDTFMGHGIKILVTAGYSSINLTVAKP